MEFELSVIYYEFPFEMIRVLKTNQHPESEITICAPILSPRTRLEARSRYSNLHS